MKEHGLTSVAQATLEAGLRWSTNILNELAGNYAKYLSPIRAYHLRRALTHLYEVQSANPKPMEGVKDEC